MIALWRVGAGLRWRLVANGLRKRGKGMFALSLVATGIMVVIGFGLLVGTAWMEADDRRAVVLFVLTMTLIAWVFGPLLIGGADETVDPSRLALLPLSNRQLAAVLAGSAMTAPATIGVGVALLGCVVAGWGGVVGGVLSFVAVVVYFVMGLGLARALAAVMGLATRSRRGRDISVFVTAVAGVTLWLGFQTIGPVLEASSTRRGSQLLDVMAWLPSGWTARAVLAARDGQVLAAIGWIALTVVMAVVFVAVWARLTARLQVSTTRPTSAATREGTVWPGVTTARQAALAKELRYSVRAPFKRVQLLLGTAMTAGFTLLQVFNADSPDARIVFLAFIGVLFASGSSFNLIGFDSPSLWLELTANGRLDVTLLRARTLASAPLVLVPLVATIVLTAAITGKWGAVPQALLCAPTAAACTMGVGAVASAKAPLPYPDSDNPFQRPNGATGCAYGLQITFAFVVLSVLLAPVLVPVVIGGTAWWTFLVALAGLGWGVVVYRAGLRWASSNLAPRGPELFAELSSRAVT
jgi:ABC-2 type transport system permease protein